MKCEKCDKDHDGKYASGRFCGQKCARSFSSQEKRQDINKRVSEKLKGIHPKVGTPHYTDEEKKEMYRKIVLSIRETNRIRIENTEFQFLGKWQRKLFVLKEQNFKCCLCGLPEEWNGKSLVLELDHIDGNSKNNIRSNVRCICPNCHSQTLNFRVCL